MYLLYDLAQKSDVQAISARKWTQDELDARDAGGRTALMQAAIRGDYKIAALLRKCGANLDLRDPDGRSAADLAALNGHSAALACIIRGGCGG